MALTPKQRSQVMKDSWAKRKAAKEDAEYLRVSKEMHTKLKKSVKMTAESAAARELNAVQKSKWKTPLVTTTNPKIVAKVKAFTEKRDSTAGALNQQSLDEAVKQMKSADLINHPKHYTSHPSGIECIQVTEHMTFNLGNATKYIWRADLKGNDIEDLGKAMWYIQREIMKRAKEKLHANAEA